MATNRLPQGVQGRRADLPFGINCDLGESFGLFRVGDDEGIMPYITTANVACGFHGGDPTVIRRTLRLAKRYGVKCGAHPSLPDLQGFGRREMRIEPTELTDMIIYQVGALRQMLEVEGMELYHVKPHGVLYSMLWQRHYAEAFADAIEAINRELPWIMMHRTVTEEVAQNRNLRVATEFTADREYDSQRRLVIVRSADRQDPEKVVSRLKHFLETGSVHTVDGGTITLRAEAICMHGDTPGAADVAKALHAFLSDAGFI